MERLRKREAERRHDTEAAGALCAELKELAPEKRLEAIAWNEHFRSPGVIRRLLADAEAAIEEEPLEAEAMAKLALAIAYALEDVLEDNTKPALQGLALAWIAESRRRRGLFEEAEGASLAAACHLDEAPLGSVERGQFCRLLARLRADQHRVDEALGLLSRAAALFAELEELQELGDTLCDQGLLLLEEMDAEGALLAFEEARALLDQQARPRSVLRARWGLALALADLGRGKEAAAAFARDPVLDVRLTRAAGRLQILWMEAQIDERTGNRSRAAELLVSIVDDFAEEGAGAEAILAAIDLARLYLSLGRSEDLQSLRQQVAARGVAETVPAAVWAVFNFVIDSAQMRPLTAVPLLTSAADYLALARHNPNLRFHPRGETGRTLTWSRLDSAFRRELCADAGVAAAVAEAPEDEIGLPARDRLTWAGEWIHDALVMFEAIPIEDGVPSSAAETPGPLPSPS